MDSIQVCVLIMQVLPWIAALAVTTLLALALLVLLWRGRKPPQPKPLPTEWSLTARPVFSTDERRIYRLLREALPHHIVLSKLPLVRFCQPNDPTEVRFWFDLLGSNHVTFAVCSANGRVLAAIDLDVERGGSRRLQQIKQSVLAACRVRYLRCSTDHLPSIAELQLLVPHSGAASRAPQPAPTHTLHEARDTLATTVATKRAERTALWSDSTLFQDSFFSPDSRLDAFASSEFSGLTDRNGKPAPRQGPAFATTNPGGDSTLGDEVGGVVVDPPHYASSTRH
jgi:hypothetical protein